MDGDTTTTTVHDEIPNLVETQSDEEDVEAGSSRRSTVNNHLTVKSSTNKYDFAAKNLFHLEPTSSTISSTSSSIRYPMHMPSFKRIDFSDLSDALVEERKPAWKLWQDSIKDSYHTVRKNAERSVEETAFNDSQLVRRRENGPYAAPAVSTSKGIEARYSKKVNDIEAHLLKTSILPNSMKNITRHDFRNGPTPAPGSVSEALADETDYQTFMPRPYYSRPNRDDPDYFDFDLQYSVDLYKRPEGKYVPRGPQTWEEKLLRESSSKGDAPLSTYMFTKGDTDWRTAGTSYLSAALRTPSFWEHRFQSIGREVRESNPISFDSLARNKPIPNRFTEYHDPDFEDLSDFDD
ncbi:Protein F13C5.5 [Dirofilaria immitis]|nr:Protein F13C5.5 [Dirofilaria immitis]